MNNLWKIGVLPLIVGACSATASVNAAMEDGSETFRGTTTGYMDGSGTIDLTSNKGLRCTGQWVFIDRPRYGRGTVQCENGLSGPFEFVGTGKHGTGNGRLGRRLYTFTFG
jgi:hypothetical protein